MQRETLLPVTSEAIPAHRPWETMDPSIVKLLEEDEDESMHSGADVEAFQAALNRDIGGDSSTSQPSNSSAAGLSHESNQASSQSFTNWQSTRHDEKANRPSQQGENVQHQQAEKQVHHSSVMDLKQNESVAENQQQHNDVLQEPNRLPLLSKQSQDGVQQGQAEQVPFQASHISGMQIPEKNPIPISDPNKMQNLEGEPQYPQKTSNQQTTNVEQAGNLKNPGKQIPFVLLLPALKPHLDKDREMQLQTLFNKLRKNDISKEQFVRLMRNIVGDQVLRLAVAQLQSQPGSNHSQLQSQALARQHHVRMPVSNSASQFSDPHSFVHQKGSSSADPSHNLPSAVQLQNDSSYQSGEINAQKSLEMERQPDSSGMLVNQMPSSSTSMVNQEIECSSISTQGHNKRQQPHLHPPQTSFSMYGSGGNYHHYTGSNVNTSGSSMKPQPHDLQMRQISHHQSMGPTQPMNLMNVPKFERQNPANDPNRVQSGSISHHTNTSGLQKNSVHWQAQTSAEQNSAPLSSVNYVKQEPVEQTTEQQQKAQLSNSQVLSVVPVEQGNTISGNLKDESLEKQSSKVGLSTPTSMGPSNPVSPSITTQQEPNVQVGSRIPSVASPAGINARTPPKKPTVGQKKPLEALGSSPPASSKKQKVSGAFSDQSIEQLNDVTAVSGVNLREEEEQLLSGAKEDGRVSEASRRVVQEEEEKLILQKTPLRKKLADIMAKCGLKNMSNDVERCLSLCVEERMRGLISNLVRLSKQQVDAEKPRHQTLITSDIRQQIMTMNRKAREEWGKKQAESEKLQKIDEPEGDNAVEGDKEKDEGRAKAVKANKEEDDKMRATAANVAARAAVGGDDMLSKWQLMAEQARQKREGGMESASSSQPAKDVNHKLLSMTVTGRNVDHKGAEKRSPGAAAAGSTRKFGRNQVQVRVARTISVKDVIAVLEREPQMSKSTLMFRLYERIRSVAAAD